MWGEGDGGGVEGGAAIGSEKRYPGEGEGEGEGEGQFWRHGCGCGCGS